MIAYFDSGTTNSRIFLLEGSNVLYHRKEKIGCKDAALAGDTSVLTKGLYKMYTEALSAMRAEDDQIEAICLSGMITSPNGLFEKEHLSLPVGLKELRESLFEYYEPAYFKRNLYLIPGLKTSPQGVKVSPEEAFTVNNVRGEEIEIIGILQKYNLSDCCILLPGSHTQTAIIRNGKIIDLLSTVTGELYGAIVQDTIIGASAGGKNLQPEWIKKGALALQEYGFNRALYITRSLELFSDTSPELRSSFLEGVINGDTVKTAAALARQHHIQNFILYGNSEACLVLESILRAYEEAPSIKTIPANSKAPMSVYGVLALFS